MKRLPIFAVAVVAISLAGCSTTEDPAKGGFLSGIKNLSDGTYERRSQEKKQTLENEQDTNLQQKRQVERLAEERDSVAADRKAAEAKYQAMQDDLKALTARISAATKRNAGLKAQTADLQRQVDDLAAKVSMAEKDTFAPDAEKQRHLDALRKEKEALEREIDMAVHR